MRFVGSILSCAVCLLLVAACSGSDRPPGLPEIAPGQAGAGPHSFARPDEVAVEHLDLELVVDFERRLIDGRVSLRIDNRAAAGELWLDSRGLEIRSVSTGTERATASFRLGREVRYLGQPLVIDIDPATETVNIEYTTGPDAGALQWFEPRQTAGGRRPFLLTQSEASLARTWIPCQDTPSVRVTYAATVEVPAGLMALMSAENPVEPTADGRYSFRMQQPIPTYLLALAVGEVIFRPLGPRSGLYAEPPVLDGAAWEFAETEAMIEAAEGLYGPYRWGRYDTIVLPSGFPFGGMENPRLTFATPTVLAGDRSLVSLVAHELAHSWSGNLVTIATWNDLWLNEGLTVYFEARIVEEIYGREIAEMEALLGRQLLDEVLAELGPDHEETRLRGDLAGRDPDDSFGDVAYYKGYLLFRLLEEQFGRERWDAFLREYFERFAFRSISTDEFLDYLRTELIGSDPALERQLQIDAWVDGTGLPSNAPRIRSEAFERVEQVMRRWLAGTPARELPVGDWTAQEWVHFVRGLPPETTPDQLGQLDAAFDLSHSGNSEILHAWLMQGLRVDYPPAIAATESFLTSMGRTKFLRPLYLRLAGTPDGLAIARRIYEKARPGYHPVSVAAIDPILGQDP